MNTTELERLARDVGAVYDAELLGVELPLDADMVRLHFRKGQDAYDVAITAQALANDERSHITEQIQWTLQ